MTSQPYDTGKGMAISPDGKFIARPSALGVDIHDLASGEIVDRLRGFLNPYDIQTVTYLGDSLIVKTTQTVERWELASHNLRQRFAFEEDYYFYSGQMVISLDGTLFAVRGKYITIYEMASGQPRLVLGSPNTRGDFLFTPDGKYLVLASGQGVGVWDIETAKRERNLAGSGIEAGALALTPDGTRLVSSTGDVWDIDTFQLITTFGGSSAPGPVAITADGNVIAASDGTLWDANTGERVGALSGLRGPATYLAFTSDSQRLIWQTEDGVIDVWGIKP
jgi:WD40 repeat protein